MANNEDYLDALTAYSKNPSEEIPPVLDQYLNRVAKNGETLFQWQLLKPLIVGKMEQVLEDLRQRLSSENIPERPNVENLRFDVMRDRIMEALQKFNGAPFTIQRLCELLIDPKQHYKRSDKFLRGLEKNVLVVSTVDPYGSRSHSDFFCRKVVSESGSKHLVNGVDTNGSPFFPRDSNISSNLPPVPGWVTTTATTTTRPQSTLSVDSSEQKPTQKQPSHDFPTAASSEGAVNSLFAEQGEQQPVVQSEEIIEETVVTMDTNEAGTVATDGGEAMAEEDDDEEEMTDDTNASSSSSSPEEPPVSDAGESQGAQTEMVTVTSSSETEARPWAVIAKGENEDSASSSIDSYSSVKDSSESSEKLSTELPPDKQTNSPSSSVENSNHEHSEDDITDTIVESEPEAAVGESVQQSLNNSVCSVDTSTLHTTENEVVPKDAQPHESTSVTASESSKDDKILSSTTSSIVDHVQPHEPPSIVDHVQPHEPSSINCSDTELSASSSTDSISTNVAPLNSSDECDNVAGLERLVDSVESSQPQASLSSSEPASTFLPTITSHTTEDPKPSPLSSSCEAQSDPEEPQAKKCRLTNEASCPSPPFTLSSTMESSSLEMDASSSDDTPVEADLMADTTSDSSSQIPAASSWDENPEVQESLDTVSCSENDMDVHANVSDSNQENVTSSPSQLLSSGDSQGFDAVEDMVHKNNADEKQTDETLTPDTVEVNTLISETENIQEPMDRD